VARRTKRCIQLVNWPFFSTRGPLMPKKPNLHTNSLNKLLIPVHVGLNIIGANRSHLAFTFMSS
jgi:hypothetical protein